MGITQLAGELGISRQMVHRLVRRGMPTGTAEEAREWRRMHCAPGRPKKGVAGPAVAVAGQAPAVPIAVEEGVGQPTGSSGRSVRDSLERAISSEIEAGRAVEMARRMGDFGLLARLRRDFIQAQGNTARLREQVADAEMAARHTVRMADAQDVVRAGLGPVRAALVAAPRMLGHRCNPGDVALAEGVLADWVAATLVLAAEAAEATCVLDAAEPEAA